MKVFLPANFFWMATVSLSVLIGMGMGIFIKNKNIEGFFVEINLHNKKKWLLSCSYNPTKMQISNHLAELSKNTDLYLTKYDQLLFLGDFNAGLEDSSVKNFCSSYNLTSMINRPTCYKNPEKPSCINISIVKVLEKI